MNQIEIRQYGQMKTSQKEKTLEVFIEGFKHLMTFSKDEQELKVLLSNAFDPSLVYAYIENEKVIGMMGIATNRVRPIRLELEQCINIYGKLKGTVLCKQMNGIFQSQVVKRNTDLYIDVLATTKKERGKGVATKLMEYAFSLPNYEEYFIEVLSKNRDAKRLYERIGFKTYKKSPISFISLMGQGYPIKMKRNLNLETSKW